MKGKRRVLYLAATALIGVAFMSGCAGPAPTVQAPSEDNIATPAWMDIELIDVATGQKFSISDFKGRTILLESFAVWCPICLAQQKEIKKLLETKGEAIVHISLDTDPNEDAARVKEHIENNDLGWYFAVSPQELTNALIDEFGLRVVSAPTAPVVLICPDQSARFLGSGVKSADKLLAEIDKDCD